MSSPAPELLFVIGLSLMGLFTLWRFRTLPQPPAMRAFPGELYAFAICALWVLGAIFVSLVGIAPFSRGRPAVVELLINGYTQHLAALCAAALAYRHVLRLAPPAAKPAHQPIAAKKILPAALLAYSVALPLTFGATLLWGRFLNALNIPAPPQDMLDYIRQAQSPGLLLLLLILPVALAPLSEELIFRGGVFRTLLRYAPRWLALVVSGFLFAIVHGYTFTLLPLTVLGVVLACAYERTGRIAVPMLVHALFNLTSVLNLFFGSAP